MIIDFIKDLAIHIAAELVAVVLLARLARVKIGLVEFRAEVKEASRSQQLKWEHDAHHDKNCFNCEFWRTKYFFMYAKKGEMFRYGIYLERRRQLRLAASPVWNF